MNNSDLSVMLAELKIFKQSLQEKIENSNQVFITTHKRPDLDAIGSSIALTLIANKLKKKCYIIMDDKIETLNSEVLSIIDTAADNIQIITTNMFKEINTDNDILIVTDTNKSNLICCENYLNDFKNIVIIDHHNQDSKTIRTLCRFINSNVSSSCEIITSLLDDFKIDYQSDIANYLLAGIILDTNKLRSKTTSENTLNIVARLLSKGGDINFSTQLLGESFESDVKIHDLIKTTDFYSYSIAICAGSNDIIYTQEELAKAANYTLKFKPDISCSIGRTSENTIGISSRSNGKIDVSQIMGIFGGGGDTYRGAAILEGEDTGEVVRNLTKILKPNYYIKEQNR